MTGFQCRQLLVRYSQNSSQILGTSTVFTQEPIRTHLIAIGVAAMLMLAGCSTYTTPNVPQEQKPPSPQQPTPSPTATPTVTDHAATDTVDVYQPATGQNLTQYSHELGAATAGLNASERQQVQELVAGFYAGLPENESERRGVILNSSERLCQFDQKYEGEVTAEMLEDGGTTTENAVRRAHYAAEITNEFNGEVPVAPLDDLRKRSGDVTKYAPLLASYNQMSDKACVAAGERTDTAIHEYQIAVVMFGVDAMLISTGAFYRPAFAGTRFTANKASQLGLYRLRYVCGNRCWALAMSEVHVALRGSMLTVMSTVARQGAEMGANLTRSDLEAVAEAQGADPDKVVAEANISVGNGTVDEMSDDVVACGEAALEGSETAEETESGDGGVLGGDGVDIGEAVDTGQELVNESQQAVGDCSESG